MTIDQLLAELEAMLAARRERKMGDYKLVPVEPAADRELLELAAKAIGQELYWLDDWSPAIAGRLWNPLTDDGDALRLAVRLNLLGAHSDEHAIGAAGMIDADPYAASRRAITRAAAEIGRAKP